MSDANAPPLSPDQEKAKASILAECDKFAAAGIKFVAVHFDGCGDDGATEDVKCYDSDEYVYDGEDPVKYDAQHLQEHFDSLVPFGYADGCGGFGDVVLDVKARTLKVERNDRFEDYSTILYEI